MEPTPKLRFVERDMVISVDAITHLATTHKVRVLQQWWKTDGWEHPDYVKEFGKWEDVPLEKEND